MIVGTEQILSFSTFSVTLDYDEFNGDFAEGVGYRRTRKQIPEVDYNLMSAPVIRMSSFARYDFEWSLILSNAKWWELEALIDSSLKVGQAGGEPGIRLIDRRLPITESVRTRAKVGDNLGTYTYWPLWNILITESTPEWFTSELVRVNLKAVELETVEA